VGLAKSLRNLHTAQSSKLLDVAQRGNVAEQFGLFDKPHREQLGVCCLCSVVQLPVQAPAKLIRQQAQVRIDPGHSADALKLQMRTSPGQQ
jgi:hypothetical protein